MHRDSILRALAGVIALSLAAPAWPSGVSTFDAIQFSTATPLSTQVISTTCNGTISVAQLTMCGSTTNIQAGMVVLDLTNPGNISNQTFVSGTPSGSTVNITQVVVHSFTGDTIEFIGQVINGEQGECVAFGNGAGAACPYIGVLAEFSKGTINTPVSPNGPLIRVSAVHEASTTDCNSNPVDGACTAPIMSFVYGTANDNDQEVAIRGAAQTNTTQSANINAIGGGFEGRCENSCISKGIGIAVGGRRDTSTGGLQGIQVTANNNVSAACGTQYSGDGPCNGIWLVGEAPSGFDAGMGLHIAGPFAEAITINNGTGGGGGTGIQSITFNDQSSSPISINVAGTHTTAAINVATSAGDVLLGANSVYNVAKVSSASSSLLSSGFLLAGGVSGSLANSGAFYPYASDTNTGVGSSASGTLTAYANVSGMATDIADFSSTGVTIKLGNIVAGAGDIVTRALQSTPQLTAAGDTTTGFYQSGGGVWKFASGGANALQMDSNGLTVLSGELLTRATQTTPQVTATGDATTGFYQSASGVWRFASGGTDIARWNGLGTTVNGYLMVGSLTNLALATGEIGLSRHTPYVFVAPGAAGAKIAILCGTTAGSAKIVAFAGTSSTAFTILDNIGSGVTGC